MPNLPGNLAVVEQHSPGGSNPYNPPAYVSARVLAANTAETITVPANATKVRLAGTADFYYAIGAAPTAVVPVDTDDGSSNELLKQQGGAEWRTCQGAAQISVISAAVCTVTASFYTN
jgi:hypothetical protein